jgi:tRNA modification GTPase
MFSTLDTIVAIATPPGRGGIGVVRISGPDAHRVARELTGRETDFQPRYATLVTVRLPPLPFGYGAPGKADTTTAGRSSSDVASGFSRTNSEIDQAIVTFFAAPNSYTGDDVVEISAHGSPVVLTAIVNAAVTCGARLAEPGEFTLRAFLNGRLDLPQAEAVADLIDASTPLQARAAFDQLNGTLTETIGAIDRALFDLIARLEASIDFPEDGYHFADPAQIGDAIDAIRQRTTALLCSARRGRLIREGFTVAIVGKPNVGKSSVFNALVGARRAIVTAVPGTTRDLVSETVDLEGLRVTLVDTAGIRETVDIVESEGVSRSIGAANVADLILMVCDLSDPTTDVALDTNILVDSNVGDVPQRGDSSVGDALQGVPPTRDSLKAVPYSPRMMVAANSPRMVVVANKADLPRSWSRKDAVEVSATAGSGIDDLRRRIVHALDVDFHSDRPAITNVRHIALVEQADRALQRARSAVLDHGEALPEEFVLADLQEARGAFEEIMGRRTSDDVLAHIFERFCIGK